LGEIPAQLGAKILVMKAQTMSKLTSKILWKILAFFDGNFEEWLGLPTFEIRNKGHFKGLAPWPRALLRPPLHQSDRLFTINENQ
jgi:hypothetical protein